MWKNNDFDKRFEKNRTNYKQLLQQQTFQGIIDTAMNHSMTIWQVETVYEVIKEKIMGALTDTTKIKKDDPANPDVCMVYYYHKLVNSPENGF